MRIQGRVVDYRNNHGVGYAESLDKRYTEKIYLHFTQFRNLDVSNNIKSDDILEFDIENSVRNGYSAVNIDLVKGENAR